ncbi:MAG TPA: EamA family transporter [Micromonosporaceae bacterium]|nr:EamA family transporter [Micromonosporaceae bacterium]
MIATAERGRTAVRPAVGVVMVVTSGALFAVNGTVSKLILEAGVDAPRLTLLRATGAWMGLTVIAFLTRPGLARLRVVAADLPLLITYGLAGFFFVPMLYFVAISRLPVGIALLFEYTAPLLVALWARFGQRQQVKSRLWYGLAGNLVGLACITQFWRASLRLDTIGVLAGVAAAGLLCFYYVLGARGVTQRDTVSLTWWAFGISAVAGLAVASVRHGALFPAHVLARDSHGVPVWALAIYLVLGGSIASYLLVAGALRHLPPTSVGIIGMIEPVIASAVAWLVLRERLSAVQLVGGVLVLVGVAVAETARTAGPGEAAEIPPA